MGRAVRSTKRKPQSETLGHILLAAQEEFGARGFSGAQMETIARKAEVTKALLYYYYTSKAGLYEAVLESLTQEILEDLATLKLLEMEPTEALTAFFSTIFDLYARKPLLAPISFDYNLRSADIRTRGFINRSVFGLMQQVMDRAIEAGDLAPETNKQDCFSFAMLIISGSFWGEDKLWGHHNSGTLDADQLKRQKAVVLAMVHAIIGAAQRPPQQ
jgi:AcrR family transcriptional regulator